MQFFFVVVATMMACAHGALVQQRGSRPSHPRTTVDAPVAMTVAPIMKCANGVCLLVDDNDDARSTGDWATSDNVVQRGVVSHWNAQRGFGFVTAALGSKDIFVHNSDLNMAGFRRLYVGDEVEFLLAQDSSNGKIKAVHVSRVAAEPISEKELDDLLAIVCAPPGMPVTGHTTAGTAAISGRSAALACAREIVN